MSLVVAKNGWKCELKYLSICTSQKTARPFAARNADAARPTHSKSPPNVNECCVWSRQAGELPGVEARFPLRSSFVRAPGQQAPTLIIMNATSFYCKDERPVMEFFNDDQWNWIALNWIALSGDYIYYFYPLNGNIMAPTNSLDWLAQPMRSFSLTSETNHWNELDWESGVLFSHCTLDLTTTQIDLSHGTSNEIYSDGERDAIVIWFYIIF